MITLYRATSEQPQTVTADSRAELARLEQERDSGPPGEYMVDAFQRMGKEKYVRLVELRGVIKEQQFFSDNEARLEQMQEVTATFQCSPSQKKMVLRAW